VAPALRWGSPSSGYIHGGIEGVIEAENEEDIIEKALKKHGA